MRWKYIARCNEYEGFIGKQKLFSIQGRLCVTDLRPCNKETWEPPQHYKIQSVEDGKQIAYDLLNNLNFDIHEKNRLGWITEGERTVKLMDEVEVLLKELAYKDKTQLKLDL